MELRIDEQLTPLEIYSTINELDVKSTEDEKRLKELLGLLFSPKLLEQVALFISKNPTRLKLSKSRTFFANDVSPISVDPHDLPKLPYSIERFETDSGAYYAVILKILGEGGNGRVKLGIELQVRDDKVVLGSLIAIKRILERINNSEVEEFSKEDFKLYASNAKQFLQGKGSLWYQSKKDNQAIAKSYFTMEYVLGEDLDEVILLDKYSLFDRLLICALASYALKTDLHDKGYLHRDLKPENMIYIHREHKIRIIDPDSICDANVSSSFEGTYVYMPIEAAQMEYSYQSDIYSLGIIQNLNIFRKLPKGNLLEKR